jgi:hypothetical protein
MSLATWQWMHFGGLLLIVMLSMVGVLGDSVLKAAAGTSAANYNLVVLANIYALTAISWYFALKHLKLATLGS